MTDPDKSFSEKNEEKDGIAYYSNNNNNNK